MRTILAALLASALTVLPAAAEPPPLATCSELARATSLTWDDPGEECSDFFFLETPATVVVRLEPGVFAGTIGAALFLFETPAASFKRTFAGGVPLDGSSEMTVDLGPGIWRLRAFTGVTPAQPCVPAVPAYVNRCGLVPGGAAGFYSVSVRLAG